MRLPFFNPRKGTDPIRLKLEAMIQVGFPVYFTSQRAQPPSPEALLPVVKSWVERHAQDPLRAGILAFLDRGFVVLQVVPRNEFPEPPPELIQSWRPGELEERRFQQATHVVVVATQDLPRHPHVGYWSAVAAGRALAEAAGGVLLDPSFPRLLSVEQQQRDLPADARIRATEVLMVPQSVDHRGLAWMTTKGMGLFGLPELEVRDAPPSVTNPLGTLINGTAQHLLDRLFTHFGTQEDPPAELLLGPEIQVTLRDVGAAYGSDEETSPPEGVRGWTHVRLEYRPGKPGHDSFLRLCPPAGFRGNAGVWIHGALADLYGTEDTLRNVATDSEAMEAAHLQAVSELPSVRERFQAGLPPGDMLIVKHGFPTGEEHHEYMWLVVNTWRGDRLQAQLANEPQIRLDLRAGQVVDLREADIYDWAVVHRDGQMEGGYTNRVVETEGQAG